MSWAGAPRHSPTGGVAVGAAHIVAIWAMLQITSLEMPAVSPAMMVSLFTETAPAPPPPARLPVPRPQRSFELPLPAAVPVVMAPESVVTSAPSAPAVAVAQPASTAPPAPMVAAAITPPRFDAAYLDNPAPSYPALSRRARETGRVMLRVTVSASGAAIDVALHTSSGYERLDRIAVDTIRRWRFVPARRGDQPVEAVVLVPIDFSLNA